jgi:hypothetical protein
MNRVSRFVLANPREKKHTSTSRLNPMKATNRLALFLALCFATFAAACGGGDSPPPPPPPTGGFSNASLKGQYAFFMSGTNVGTGAFFARIGSFAADGSGNITTGLEDVDVNGPETIQFSPSSYTILANGRGTINLVNNTGNIAFSVTMLSATEGLIVETDGFATGSGHFFLQDANAFANGFNGNYAFDVSGVDFTGGSFGVPDSIVGQFVANGSGGLGGLLDENDNASPTGAQPISGSFQVDPSNNTDFGRGEMTFVANGTTFNYVYYVVSASRLVLIENSNNSGVLTAGTAVAQSSVPVSNNTFNGSFVFLTSGSGTIGPLTRIGRFNANGGGLTSLFADTNDSGSTAQVPKGALSNASYLIDTVFAGSGRGTLTFTDSSLGTYSFVFYLSSASSGVIQDTTTTNSGGNVGDGFLQLQTGAPFSIAGLAGDYGLNFPGVSHNSNTTATAEEDYVGQITFVSASAGGNVSGAVDFSEFSSNQGFFLDVVVSGNGLSIGGDGSTSSGTRNALSLKLNSNPSSTLNFVPYIVDSQHMFVAGTDNNRVISGVITLQNP